MIKIKVSKTTSVWLHGILGAGIGAVGSTLSNLVVAPEVFNVTSWHGLRKMAMSAVISAIGAMGLYLKQFPQPSVAVEEQQHSEAEQPDGTVLSTDSTKKTTISTQ